MSEENKLDAVPSVDDVVLLPCPFCGGPANCVEQRFTTTLWYSVGCTGCGFRRDVDSREDAGLMWNRREALLSVEGFVDREIEAMDESGHWSFHAIDALLCLQSRIDVRLADMGKPSQ